MTDWRKSSHSNTSGGDCVEVANLTGNVGLRDSKTISTGHLSIAPSDFARLVKKIKGNSLDL